MRTILGPKPGELRKYVPTAFGNNLEANPVTVWIRNPTERKKRELFSHNSKTRIALGPNGKPLLGPDGKPSAIEVEVASAVDHQNKMVADCVEKVENYIFCGVTVTDGALLAEYGEREIVAEVADEVLLALSLTVDERKNFSAPPQSVNSAAPDTNVGIALKLGLADSETVKQESMNLTP
jgi:hypothetical protein